MHRVKVIAIALSFALLCTSCRDVVEPDIETDAKGLSNYIIANATNDDIELNNTLYSNNGVLIELYGSDSAADALEIVSICNKWLSENEDSILIRDSIMLSIEIYPEKPNEDDRDSLRYSSRVGNYDVSFASDVYSIIDCIDINYSVDFDSSLFENYDFRYIGVPSNIVIDDFGVFVDMDRLQYLIVNDGPFGHDEQLLDDKYQEFCDYYNAYDELQFECSKVL